MTAKNSSPASSRGFSLKGGTGQRWCSNLQTAADGQPHAAVFTKVPEAYRILNMSRTGRIHWRQNQFVPPVVRQDDIKPKSPEPTEEEQEQLIYLAIYRDKVAQHQAAFENGGASLHSELSEHVVSEDWRQQSGFRDSLNVKRSATVHTAAVNTKSASLSQGSVEEHFEAKRLGKLFDEMRALQKAEEEDGTALTRPRSESRRKRIAQPEALEKDLSVKQAPASARNYSAGSRPGQRFAPKSPSTSKGGTGTASRPSQHPDDISISGDDHAEAASSPGGASAALDRKKAAQERKRLERLWTVLTNSKVRFISLSDNLSKDPFRQDPTHLESFPPLNLTKLYAGPWRLDPLKGTGDQQSYSANR